MEFKQALPLVLKHEGGLVDNPDDRGGITKYGISLRAYPHLGRSGIRNLTKEQAGEYYKTDYWLACNCDDLPTYIRYIVFDCAVNQGPSFARKALQRCVGASPDGIIGVKTLKAVKALTRDRLVHTYGKERAYRYMSNKKWDIFGHGWMSRLIDVLIKT